MAEGVVSFVLEKLSNPLLQEAALLHGVRAQVEWLRTELRWMECFLKDAETKRRMGNELANNWVREVREVACQAEDIIDTFMLQIEGQPRRQKRQLGSKIMWYIKRYASYPSELKARHKIDGEIEGLKSKIDHITDSRARYGLVSLSESIGEASTSAAEEALQAQRQISPRLDNHTTIVVGFDAHKEEILRQSIDATATRRCVISIVGIGGLGKTTLATKVYNSSEIGSCFDTRACVSVSQDYRPREILKNIIKQVMGIGKEELEREDEQDLKARLYDYSKERRYFIVLDDIWSADVWRRIRGALPDTRNGSRVLITTRSTEVATSADPSVPPCQLPFLNDQDSWRLFLRKAFTTNQETEPSCPKELEDVAQQLVSRCGGLPLALVVLGGLLSRKDVSPVAWRRVANSIDWASTKEGEECLKILALSYNDLPHHSLRSCFLYMGLFREDWMFRAEILIRLWMAEGFIPESENGAMTETALAYLDELAQRSMIQVTEEDWVGRALLFKIHDLFRDLCLREGREDGFLDVNSGYGVHGRVMRDHNLRRLALQNLDTAEDCYPLSKLRSLLAFDSRLTSNIFHRLKMLRVLCLVEIEGLESLPEEIKSMTHLRCLVLKDCPVLRELPSSIGYVRNLQTLIVERTGIKRLPEAWGKIHTLRHLELSWGCECPPIGSLTNLQTLRVASARGGWIESDLGKLCNIQTLGLGLELYQGKEFLDSVGKLERLSKFIFKAQSILPEIIPTLSNHIYLHKLWLVGRWSQGQLPNGHGFPPNLTALALSHSELEQDPMAVLEKLPNLETLKLWFQAYVGKDIACNAGGFPRLRRLEFYRLNELECWSVEAGAMPKLRYLGIGGCERLAMLPEGLQHVTSLRVLEVGDPREEFRDRLRDDAGKDWHKIRHVRSIKVSHQKDIAAWKHLLQAGWR